MPRAPLGRRNARPTDPPPRPHAGARALADRRSPHRAHRVFDPTRQQHGEELGVPVSAAVLQRVGPQGVSDAGERGRDDGADPQFLEREGVGRGAEVGGSGQQVRVVSPSSGGFARLTERRVCVSGFGRDERLQLVRFKGRPGELSPKARFFLFAGWLLPDRFKYVFRIPSTPQLQRY